MEERRYQERAVRQCLWKLEKQNAATLLVGPTGSGKTFMMSEVARRLPGRTTWVTHTRDLVEQSAEKLRSYGLRVGVIAAGYEADPFASFQVASVQTLLSREIELRCENLILDEAHHYMAADWRRAIQSRHVVRTLGGTATPERADGQALGDIFQEMVVAAHYSELIAEGFLVPVRLLRPTNELSKGLAQKFVKAYLECGEGRQAFGYCRNVKEAQEMATALCSEGHPSAFLGNETPREERTRLLGSLGNGAHRMLTSVHALSEGVDVPVASCAVLGGNVGHVAIYLQRVGRVLRAHPGKVDALVLDLPGVSHRLGLPTEDREYSLTGAGIRRTATGQSLRVCLYCGMTFEPSGEPECPRCGQRNPVVKPRALRIYNRELETVFAGAETPEWAKRGELERLRRVAKTRGLGIDWVSMEYEKMFGESVRATLRNETSSDGKREEFDRLARLAQRRGYSIGWASHRYKNSFGAFPPREWTKSEVSDAGD